MEIIIALTETMAKEYAKQNGCEDDAPEKHVEAGLLQHIRDTILKGQKTNDE